MSQLHLPELHFPEWSPDIVNGEPQDQAFARNLLLRKKGYTGPLLSPEDVQPVEDENLARNLQALDFLLNQTEDTRQDKPVQPHNADPDWDEMCNGM